MLSQYSLIRTIYIYIAPLLVKNSKAFSKIYTKNYIYFTEYSHRRNENQQLWSSAEERYTTVANKTQSKHPKNPKQKTPEMPDPSEGKGDVSMQTAMWSRSVCALRSSLWRQETYFIMIKAPGFIHVQPIAFLHTEGDSQFKLRTYREEWTRNTRWILVMWKGKVSVRQLWTALIWPLSFLLYKRFPNFKRH